MKPDSKQDLTDKVARMPSPMPVLPLKSDPASYSTANKKMPGCPIQRLYPWLLFASTAVAATFCLAYISKPVILTSPAPTPLVQGQKEFAANNPTDPGRTDTMIPDGNSLPGTEGSVTGGNPPATPLASDFEETNIRIQHVLDAEFPSGDVSRIIVDVPVLYHSRSLRWTQEEAARARVLLDRLAVYQDRIRNLRSEGTGLLDEWNSLMTGSIPGEALRADSPSLPANQQDDLSPDAPRASDTVDTIKLQNTEE